MIFSGNNEIKNVYFGTSKVDKIYNGNVEVWTDTPEIAFEPLCFTAEEANSTFRMNAGKNISADIHLACSTDGENWQDLTFATDYPLANVGDKLYVRSNGSTTFSTSYALKNSVQCVMTGKIAATGSVQWLIDNTGKRKDVTQYCFSNLFNNCTALTLAPTLDATQLNTACYCYMFYGCTGLTSIPELPAKQLAQSCYCYMFQGCTGLTSIPDFNPDIVLANNCFENMFNGCSITEAPALPYMNLTENCYRAMFQNCNQLTTAPELPATNLESQCYYMMFTGCSSLVDAPYLRATELKSMCYGSMFSKCTSLDNLSVAFAEFPSYGWSSPTGYWLNAAKSTGNFYCPQSVIDSITTRDVHSVPSTWNMIAI